MVTPTLAMPITYKKEPIVRPQQSTLKQETEKSCSADRSNAGGDVVYSNRSIDARTRVQSEEKQDHHPGHEEGRRNDNQPSMVSRGDCVRTVELALGQRQRHL